MGVETTVIGVLIAAGAGVAWLVRWALKREALDHAERGRLAAERGWEYSNKPEPSVHFILSGSTDGIGWKLKQERSGRSHRHRSRHTTMTWSTEDIQSSELLVALLPRAHRQIYGNRLVQGVFNFGLKTLSLGLSIQASNPFDALMSRGRDIEFSRPELSRQYVIWTADEALGARLASQDAESALLRWLGWGGPEVSVFAGPGAFRVTCPSFSLEAGEAAKIDRFVDLSLAFARAYLGKP